MLRRITWLGITFHKSPFTIIPTHLLGGRNQMQMLQTDSIGQHAVAVRTWVISVIGDRRMMTQRQMMRLIFDSF